MIARDVTSSIEKFATQYPVIAILGPRQSGKTTLAKEIFSKHIYISFEDIDMREFAESDPRRFLAEHENNHGLILDEIQHVPSILSYIQTYVDKHDSIGYFILTGSQNSMVHQAAAQTLAGRMAVITLLPLSIHELSKAKKLPTTPEKMLLKGCYPRIYAKKLAPGPWYSFYNRMYIERDVRLITNVTDLGSFQRFLLLCAGRIGQLLNISSLAADCGISVNTAKSWLSILQASYIIFLLQPYYKNFSKRVIKSPKLYFYDTGLAAVLLGIQTDKQMSTHYLRGGLFESMVLGELMKNAYNNAQEPNLYFWRDSQGHEVDGIIERAGHLLSIEIKSGYTINSDFFDALEVWNELSGTDSEHNFLIYGGDVNQKRSKGNVVSWGSIAQKVKI
jgi:predicted AAA+ superfamily ATPase